MTRSTRTHSGEHLPRPILKQTRWLILAVWFVPLLAAGLVAYFLYDHLENQGATITVRFEDATGLKAGETLVAHRGVQIGQVYSIELSPDQKQALVHVRLHKSAAPFAAKGAVFWIVRPEVSTQEISGLGTVLSGPIISATPGTGQAQTEFTGLESPPVAAQDGITIVLKAASVEHLAAQSPIFYRGLQVGAVDHVQLSSDATTADVHAFIQRAYVPLVRANSQFWAVSAVDLKGGIFTGIQLKVESIRSLLSGGIAFATPDEKTGPQAADGAAFTLNSEPKKEWAAWSPKIAIEIPAKHADKPSESPAFAPATMGRD